MRSTVSTIEPLEARIAPAALGSVDLSKLNGSNGFKIDAGNFKVAGVGDVNGDGFADVIVDHGGSEAPCYVIFGQAGGFTSPFDLTKLNGANGFGLTHLSSALLYESAVSGAVDLNGDGYDDVIIGDADGAPHGFFSGTTYVVLGKASGFAPTLDLATLGGSAGFKIQGEAANDLAGIAVSGAGDVNGDHIGDLIIGARGANSGQGAAYVVFGNRSGFSSPIDLSTLNGATGFKILGEAAGDHFGGAVSGAGDVNGDGVDDILIGAADASPNGAGSGASYVIFGSKAGFTTPINASGLTGATGFKMVGAAAGDQTGGLVSGAGDLNGDGVADLAVGTLGATLNSASSGYVVFGKKGVFTSPLALSALGGADGFKLINPVSNTPNSSVALSKTGDVNGDGLDDLLVGFNKVSVNGTFSGEAFVVFGRKVGFAASLDPTTLNGINGIVIPGEGPNMGLGRSVSAAGDLNGDGFDDIVIGAVLADSQGPGIGAAYVLFGGESLGSPVTFSKDHKSGTFPDPAGDLVTVKISKGYLALSNFQFAADGSLQGLNLAATHRVTNGDHSLQAFTVLNGSDVTVSAKTPKHGTGSGLADVNIIDGSGLDLGKVSVSGRLEQILAGDRVVKTAGVKSLTVGTLGQALAVPGLPADYHSLIVGAVGALTVKGDARGVDFEVIGGPLASIGTVNIKGSLDANGVAAGNAAYLHATGNIGAVTIGKSVIGGADFSGLGAGGKLGRVSIGGALTSASAAKPVTISALGKLGALKAGDSVAIAGLSVKTNVLNARILAGYTTALVATNPDAGIGAISVLGNWEASSVAAGVQDTSVAGTLSSLPDGFGRHDSLIAEAVANHIFASIASITIKGTAIGSVTPSTDFFGFTAQHLGALKIGGMKKTLTAMAEDLILDPVNNDFHAVDFG